MQELRDWHRVQAVDRRARRLRGLRGRPIRPDAGLPARLPGLVRLFACAALTAVSFKRNRRALVLGIGEIHSRLFTRFCFAALLLFTVV